MTIHEVIDPIRGCGKRKAGGLYLVAGEKYSSCCALPVPLTVCPCCGQGIKFFRGFGWIEPGKLFEGVTCSKSEVLNEMIMERTHTAIFQPRCIVENLPDKMGLMWVGEQFYTPTEFINEGVAHGISKRIATIPNGFEVGKTWLALAHRKAIYKGVELSVYGNEKRYAAGVFMFFKPSRIEYVMQGNETTEFLQRLEKRGVTLVKVVGHIGEQTKLI